MQPNWAYVPTDHKVKAGDGKPQTLSERRDTEKMQLGILKTETKRSTK